MTFSTPFFLFLFLPFTLMLVYVLKPAYRNGFLLLASLFFYVWGEHSFVYIILISILANFAFGQWIENPGKHFSSKAVLITSVFFNLSLIVYFKYFNFLSINYVLLLKYFHIEASKSYILAGLPVGLSFFTFQNISYVTDVYRRQISAENKLLNYGLYISFFPHLVAGPIVRYKDIALDISKRSLQYPWIISGIKRFILGLSKKVLIANTLGFVADELFALPHTELNISLSWLAVICYSLQIYFDFSGYSDMAIGLSRLFGFNFHENFNYPYISTSITEFWRRWHISLSTWFRDYVYIPMGGNRKGKFRTVFNLLIVFFLTGLWHGANWNFIIWGMAHGFFMLLERIGQNKVVERLSKPLAHLYFLVVVMVTWVFFRLTEVDTAFHFVQTLFGLGAKSDIHSVYYYLTTEVIVMLVAGILFSTPLFESLVIKYKASKKDNQFLILSVYILLLLLSIFGLSSGTYNPFIYSRF